MYDCTCRQRALDWISSSVMFGVGELPNLIEYIRRGERARRYSAISNGKAIISPVVCDCQWRAHPSA